MGKQADAPPPVDYAALAKQQGAENRATALETARLSNPNISGPLGSQTVSWKGGTPYITQTLSPAEQQKLENEQNVQIALGNLGRSYVGNVAGTMANPFAYQGQGIQTSLDLSNAPKMPISAGQTAQEAIMKRLQPQIEQNRASLTQNLANQGITPGSEAYNRAMTENSKAKAIYIHKPHYRV